MSFDVTDDETRRERERVEAWADRLRRREWWTYPEALFFLALQDEVRVAEFMADDEGWKSGQGSFLGAMVLSALHDPPEAVKPAATEIRAKSRSWLMAALQDGCLRAQGRRSGQGDLAPIPAAEWGALVIEDGPGLPNTVNAWHRQFRGNPTAGPTWWSDLLFSRDDLKRLAASEASTDSPTKKPYQDPGKIGAAKARLVAEGRKVTAQGIATFLAKEHLQEKTLTADVKMLRDSWRKLLPNDLDG